MEHVAAQCCYKILKVTHLMQRDRATEWGLFL